MCPVLDSAFFCISKPAQVFAGVGFSYESHNQDKPISTGKLSVQTHGGDTMLPNGAFLALVLMEETNC